jgi:hypothetical protein
MLRIGMVDCASSHVVSFTKRLHHVDIEPVSWVEGARVVAAVPGTSAERPERIPGFIEQLRGYGVEILERPEELIGRVDAVFLERVEGSKHLERGLPFIQAGLPLFVDKVFTDSTADAKALVAAAQRHRVGLSAGSSLRFTVEVQDIHQRREEAGAVLAVEARGPEPWHTLDLLCGLMGPGCHAVRCIVDETTRLFVARWAGGRIATMRLPRRGKRNWGFTAFCEREILTHEIDTEHNLRELLTALLRMIETGEWPVSAGELIEPVAFREAAAWSEKRGGEEVALAR